MATDDDDEKGSYLKVWPGSVPADCKTWNTVHCKSFCIQGEMSSHLFFFFFMQI